MQILVDVFLVLLNDDDFYVSLVLRNLTVLIAGLEAMCLSAN